MSAPQAAAHTTGSPGPPGLFTLHRERPGLLLRELAWRWGAGSVLCGIAAYQGWRIWLQTRAALTATGILGYRSADALTDAIADPARLLTAAGSAVHLLQPLLERSLIGLLPLFLFCWAIAFGFGRTHVLRRWNPWVPARPLLLAQAEAMRLVCSLAVGLLWVGFFALSMRLPDGAGGASPLLSTLLLGAALLATWGLARMRPVLIVASALALVEGGAWTAKLRPAWRLIKHPALGPLRVAVRRSRMVMAGLALVLMLVPAPFGLGWPLLAWWAAWSLPPLAAADAWRLGAFFTLLGTLRSTSR